MTVFHDKDKLRVMFQGTSLLRMMVRKNIENLVHFSCSEAMNNPLKA